MNLPRRPFVACVLAFSAMPVVSACADADPPAPEPVAIEATDSPLIYGNDDRKDFYQLTDPGLIALANSTAVLVESPYITAAAGGGWTLDTSWSFGSAYQLCSTEPYRTQPTTGFCSGFVIGPDLIATAGHCITTTAECNSTYFAFGFRMDDASTVRKSLPADDVYKCTAIVARAETSTNDYGIIRVERAIVGHPALAVRKSGKVADGAALVLSGYPAGIPLKVAGGATVRGNTANDYFEANVDSYGGNSGSPVVDATTRVVEGILVRGNNDFVYNRTSKCYRSQVCADSGCPGWEEATRSTKWSSYVGCASNAECDDGNPCNGSEVCNGSSCAAGTPIDCGDGNACTSDACLNQSGSPACSSTTISCNDGNACTTDSCNPASGCAFAPITCPAGQTCNNGVCGASCKPQGGSCTKHSDCCSGSCNLNKHKCRA